MVRPIVNRFKDSNSIAIQVAEDLRSFISAKLESQDRVDVAVTGGTLGIATLAAASQLDFSNFDLNRLHIWWGDERFVASDHSDRNALQAWNAWFSKIDIPKVNLHEFPSADHGLDLFQAASNFNDSFEASGVVFDLMLMGMGPDGHIASLFPGHSVGTGVTSVEAESDSPKPPPQRLTFSYGVINQAREIWFTVAGSDKAEAVATVFGEHPTELPAGRVSGKEKTVWYVDQTAGNLVWGC